MDREEVIARCSRATKTWPRAWVPAVNDWWSAGGDLEKLVEWVEANPIVGPRLVRVLIPYLNASPVEIIDFAPGLAALIENESNEQE